MLRRAVLISSVLGVVSAAAALAFAPNLTRVGRIVSSLAPWRAQGFTPAPSRDPMHRVVPRLVGQAPDSLAGKFCPFPAPGSTSGHATDLAADIPLRDSDELLLQGQSRVVRTDSAAICAGSTPPPLP